MYKNYVFDLYGTLVDVRTNENKSFLWKKMSEIYTALGAPYSASELKEYFRELEKKQMKELPEFGEPDLRRVFAELFWEKGISCDQMQARTMAITFRTLSRQKIGVYAGVKETLTELKKRGKKIYLLSNAQTDFTRPELDMLGLTSFFDGIMISSEEGYKKPAKELYDRLFGCYSITPQESLMIGNDEQSDIAGAILAEMDSLYIHTEISPELTAPSLATYTVLDGDWHKAANILLL